MSRFRCPSPVIPSLLRLSCSWTKASKIAHSTIFRTSLMYHLYCFLLLSSTVYSVLIQFINGIHVVVVNCCACNWMHTDSVTGLSGNQLPGTLQSLIGQCLFLCFVASSAFHQTFSSFVSSAEFWRWALAKVHSSTAQVHNEATSLFAEMTNDCEWLV